MSSAGAAPSAAVSLSARAEASRRNGAKSRGPKTPEGKARSARNALKHGLCAEKFLVPLEEDAGAFVALQAALLAELAPVGAVQTVLAQRVVSAAWRLARADEIEAGVLAEQRYRDGGLGLAVIRDGNGARALPTLPRYRGAALAEFLRCLRVLQTLQVEARAIEVPASPRRHAQAEPTWSTPPARITARPTPAEPEACQEPNEPDVLDNPGASEPAAHPAPELEQFPARPARARSNQPGPVPAASLARLQRDLDEAIQVAERGGTRHICRICPRSPPSKTTWARRACRWKPLPQA